MSLGAKYDEIVTRIVKLEQEIKQAYIEKELAWNELCKNHGRFSQFTPQEHKIAAFILEYDQCGYKDIARHFNISRSTVRFHISSLYKKTLTRNRRELINKLNGQNHPATSGTI